EFFDDGFKRGPKVLPDAQRRYETLRSDSQNDPRIDYALGLVYLRQLKNKEAQTQFLLATKRTGEPYWPAWQALIWTHGTAKETTVAYERLTEMAKRLVKLDNAPELDAVAEQVDWIGQSMAAFEKMGETTKAREAWMRQDETLRELFAGKLLGAYNSGLEEVHTRHALLEDDIRTTRDKTLEKREQERIEKQSKVGKDLESTKEKRDGLKKTAEEWKKILDDQLLNFDKQLSRLERDHTFLEKRGQSIVESQIQLGREMTLLQQRASAGNQPNNQFGTQTNYEAQMDQLQLQKVRYQAEYDQTLVAAQQVTQKAQGLIQQRNGVVQQYQKATGQLVQQDASLDKWQGRLKKDTEKLKAPADDKVPAVTNKIKQVRSFRTYIELDVIEQRDRLLDSFGVTMPEKPARTSPIPGK
ncbi:MAG: hypothetical protein H7062_01515, partial [Candidatus Saccharimonas sp.]|nr:hypothetical protein [Planctomycetaceae bacterium]